MDLSNFIRSKYFYFYMINRYLLIFLALFLQLYAIEIIGIPKTRTHPKKAPNPLFENFKNTESNICHLIKKIQF